MGTVCGFYRMSDQTIDHLKKHPVIAQKYIDENYTWVTGKHHIKDDTAFYLDKAWDIAKFLLKKCDTSPQRVLGELDGFKIDPSGDWQSPRYILSEKVKEIDSVFETISLEHLKRAYSKKEMIRNKVYRANMVGQSDWDYIFSHVQTMKRAFAKASECGDGIVINFF